VTILVALRYAPVALLLALAACGPGGDPAALSPGENSSTTPATAPTPPATSTSTATAEATGGREGTGLDGEQATVTEVVDGDTIKITSTVGDERVRLIGINAAERGECLADEATSRLTEMILGQTVTLESDTTDSDQYGRLLRYVHLGDELINTVMVEEGLAIARRYEPDTARANELDQAQDAAQQAGLGLWHPEACGPATGDRIEIADYVYDADGDDNKNKNGEWVELNNPQSDPIDMTGWVLRDASASHRYGFPAGFTLQSNATVRVYTGCGTDTSDALYWCNQGSAIWNNGGDTIFVLDPAGNTVVSKKYG